MQKKQMEMSNSCNQPTIELKSVNVDLEESNSRQQSTDSNDENDLVGLKKSLGFPSCVGMLVGIIIGSGIFISPKGVLYGSGSIGLTFIIWILCGAFTLLGAMALAELGCTFPTSGGAYKYILEGFAPNRRQKKTFWGPLIPYLVSWQGNLIGGPAGIALQGLACAEYLHQLASRERESEESALRIRILGACIIVLATAINYFSVTWSTRIINVFSSGKIISLAFIIISGLVMLGKGTNEALHTGFEGTQLDPQGISLAFYSGLWALSGWGSIAIVVKELKSPKRDLLRSLVVSILLIVACYVLANIAYFTVLSKEEFLASNAVAVDFARKIGGEITAVAMVLMVAASVFGSALGATFTSTRMIYAAGREGHLWEFLSFLHINYMTPAVSILLYGGLALLLVSQSSILGLISLFGFIDSVIVALAMVSLIIVRKTRKLENEELTFPLIVPFIVIAFNCFLIITPFLQEPLMEYLYVLAMLSVGFVTYVIFVYYEFRIKILEDIKIFGQKLLNVAPPEDKDT